MGQFLLPTDIANRGLDHCGQDPISNFAERTKKAGLCGRVYDPLRRAELRRNVWRFAIKRAALRAIDANTMLLAPSLWVDSVTYFEGSIVIDETGQMWVGTIPNNLGYQPGQSTAWQQYFGPVTVSLYQDTVAYLAGELVYTTDGDGKNRVYVSLQNNNQDNPATPTDWDETVTYYKNQVVTYFGTYMSRTDLNIGNVPTDTPADWNNVTAYSIGNQVVGSDNIIYTSLVGPNLDHDPVLAASDSYWQSSVDLGQWTNVFVGGAGSINWLQIGGAEFPYGVTLQRLNIIYPLGSGPSTQTASRNVYRLPSSFLRMTSRDPRAGSTSALGAPTNLAYTDWLIEGQYIVSQQSDPIMLRFVADIVNVREMDDMFCEGLGARMGYEMCEPLTQSGDKLHTIASIYEKNMGDARTVNAIEVGPEESPLDDWLAVRY